jgi:hypothetical protein
VNLIFTVVNWRARIQYERVRAESIATVARVVSAGGSVRDHRADGTVLYVDIPSHQVQGACRRSEPVSGEESEGKC